jgi:hydroxymethylbilane synthase
MGGVGVFTKALQVELLEGRGDLAVHSLKDLPSRPVEGLTLAACLARAPHPDALVSAKGWGIEDLPQGAVIGTGSPRRRALLAERRPDLRFVELRGNLDTRRRKALEGEVDAAVLARAGLERMEWWDEHCAELDPAWMVPAPCQGILGVEAVAGSPAAALLEEALDEPEARGAATAERALLRALDAGCDTPVGGLAEPCDAGWKLRAFLAAETAGPCFRAEAEGEDPGALGEAVAAALVAQQDQEGCEGPEEEDG